MKRFVLLATVWAGLAAAVAPAGIIVYRIDFGPDGQAVQAGFEKWSIENGTTAGGVRNIKPVDNPTVHPLLATTVTAGTDDPTAKAKMVALTRGGPPAAGTFTYTDLLKDFVGSVDDKNSSPTLGIVLDGLLEGHRYNVRFWSFDDGAAAGAQKSDWYIAGQKNAFYNYSYDSSKDPQTNTDTRASFVSFFDVDKTRKLSFQAKYAGGSQVSVVLNGIEVEDLGAVGVPEPSVVGMAAAGLVGVAAVVRRFRTRAAR
ncbi:MAG: hypothetical protein K2X82_00050 [Gemmataceae bacterium]|nr:hypothetical protein [Gemmataceae bacterium]